MNIRLGVIDYGAGNLRSVCNTFSSLGFEPQLVTSPAEMESLSHLVLPGVGAFGDCALKLRQQSLEQPIKDWIGSDRPFLGICVGYQVLFDSGEENPGIPGLGIFRGKVVKFKQTDPPRKIPHMGWNSLHLPHPDDLLWKGVGDNPYFYFVHSYYPEVEDQSLIAATCCYGTEFAATIRRGNLVATQFHPEKSQKLGAKILSNFLDFTP